GRNALYPTNERHLSRERAQWIAPPTLLFAIEKGACAMSVSQHDWSLHRKGQIDQERHKEKIREAIKKNLGEIVSEESIILSDGTKRVRVPIRSLDEYRFRFDPGK